ncbi:MAG: DUF190 domain-containing protein [Comamonadaceae bacterium]|nr:DUF190 domain-containing protein [Comamonadaceae bacterium]
MKLLLNLFFRKKISGVSVFRGVGRIWVRTAYSITNPKVLDLSNDLPVKIEVVDSDVMIEEESCLTSIRIVEKGSGRSLRLPR